MAMTYGPLNTRHISASKKYPSNKFVRSTIRYRADPARVIGGQTPSYITNIYNNSSQPSVETTTELEGGEKSQAINASQNQKILGQHGAVNVMRIDEGIAADNFTDELDMVHGGQASDLAAAQAGASLGHSRKTSQKPAIIEAGGKHRFRRNISNGSAASVLHSTQSKEKSQPINPLRASQGAGLAMNGGTK